MAVLEGEDFLVHPVLKKIRVAGVARGLTGLLLVQPQTLELAWWTCHSYRYNWQAQSQSPTRSRQESSPGPRHRIHARGRLRKTIVLRQFDEYIHIKTSPAQRVSPTVEVSKLSP